MMALEMIKQWLYEWSNHPSYMCEKNNKTPKEICQM